MLRVALKTKTCLSFSILRVQPSAVESEKKQQERHIPSFFSSLITLTAASMIVKNAGRMNYLCCNVKHVLNCVTFSGSISLSHFIPCTDLVGGAGTWSLQSDVCFSGVSLF